MRKRTDGFTLVELMVVVLVIGILVAVAVPVFKAAKTAAQKNTCQSFQRTWAGVVQQAKADGHEPNSTEGLKLLSSSGNSVWWSVANTYLKSVPVCPTSRSAYWVYEDVSGTSANGNLCGCKAGSAEWTDDHGLLGTTTDSNVIVWDGLVYKVITAEDGRQWLDRNLGAKAVWTSTNGSASYGWLYQWGRGNDGHQYTTWGGQPNPALSGTTTELAETDTPGPLFIVPSATPLDWRKGQNPKLWQALYDYPNNPCPPGFHVPTQAEWANWVAEARVTNASSASLSALRLPAAGWREYSGIAPTLQGGSGYYWTSTIESDKAYPLNFDSGAVSTTSSLRRARGMSVRAIKNSP